MKSNKRLWALATAGALAISNLSMIAMPLGGLTAFAASGDFEQHKITYGIGSTTGITGDLVTKESLTVSDGDAQDTVQKFTAAKIEGVSRVGYKPNGYTVPNNTVYKDNSFQVPTTDLEENADYFVKTDVAATVNWALETYKLSYDANGYKEAGSITDTPYDVTSSNVKTAGKITREGFEQVGWSTRSSRNPGAFNPTVNKGEDFNADETFDCSIASNLKLYAIWEAQELTVKFYENASDQDPAATQKITAGKKTALKENTFTKEGYSFAGWAIINNPTEVKYADKAEVTITANMELVPVWKAGKYSVTFDANGGKGSSIAPLEFEAGESKSLPTNTFTRDNYTSAGWALDAEGKKPISDTSGLTGNTTVYAVYNAKNYTVKFDGNGANGGAMGDQTITYDVDATLNENKFTLTGYDFAGWSTSSSATTVEYADKAKVKNLTDGEGTITLYAIWEGTASTVYYNNNGGTGNMTPDRSVTFPYKIKDNAGLEKNGYRFDGWVTDPKATAVEYKANDYINKTSSKDITLYAFWVPEECTVVFDPNGNGVTGEMDDQKFNFASGAKLNNNNYAYADHTFLGWSKKATGEVVYANEAKVNDEDFVAPDYKLVLYAQWEVIDADATEAAQKAAKEATDAATAADTKAAAAQTAAEAAAKVAGVDADVAEAAKAAAGQATKSAEAAKTAATNATTAAKAATDAASGVAPKAADGSAKDAPAAAGTELVDANGNKTGFKVTDANASAPEVEYVGPSDKNATKADIPETQTDLSGNTYKVTSVAANAFEGSKVKTVTIRKNIKKIDPNAFKKSKVKNVKIKSVKLTKKMTKAFKKLKKGGKITVSGKHKAKNKELLNKLSNVKNGKTKVK